MAPPQVDVAKKQPLEDVQGLAEVVGDQKLPPKEGLVPVESSVTVQGKRTVLAKRRCKKLIIGIVIGAVVATLITVGAFMAHRHHHPHHWKGQVEDKDGHRGEEEYRTEGSRRLIHIARNESNYFFRMLAVLDYETQLAGFKDCGRQVCYVDRLRESYEDGCRRWYHFRRHHRLLYERPLRVGPEVAKDVLQYIGGEAIYEVCGNLPSFWVIEHHGDLPADNTTRIIYL